MSSMFVDHIQSMVFALDMTGLNAVRDVFRCFEDKRDTIFFSELGLGGRIITSGYVHWAS
jgi:hypothetical protein